ncbi:MAG: hypothetical protein HOK21_19830 [Rhodospirillaceae bacterium]|jgi:citrate synthase|nr:hypothetical protein [Rhodospirillaceae bacterium]MBT5526343.1 hypothetical protein [Rhodospirillaceae bacterium]MBT5881583.1 hypothetical protein [Rhodospirillaceae bacterium]MBT6591687.1 hypothetical protein [Rhodospirillaceae bacterium]MBT6609856.1 hypothetical protein [Rhodospirillaceae bacterium]
MSNAGNPFDGYWTTKISSASKGRVLVRGYPAEELIERLKFAETTYLIIKGELPTTAQAEALDAVLRSGLDQQFISSAVPAARFAASAAPEAPAAAIAAGVIAFGSVTGSPAKCGEMLLAGQQMAVAEGLDISETAHRILQQYSDAGQKVPGLGHPMHKQVEPRAQALREIALRHDAWGTSGQLLAALESQSEARFARHLPFNLAAAVAAVLAEIGFAPIEMTGIAIMGYIPALIAHTVEEVREGVPLRIIPDELGARYAGPPERTIPDSFGQGRDGEAKTTTKE